MIRSRGRAILEHGRLIETRGGDQRDLGQPDLVREILARRIIEVARTGECDPDELCARALQALGFGKRQIV
jgi:hypothetical protein